MKKIIFRMCIMGYMFLSLFVMCVAIALPFMFGMKEFSYWYLTVYPVTLFLIASQEESFKLFKKYF